MFAGGAGGGVSVILSGLVAAPSPRTTIKSPSVGPAKGRFGRFNRTPKSYQPRISPSNSRLPRWISTCPGSGPRPSPATITSAPAGARIGLHLERGRIDRQHQGTRNLSSVVRLGRLGHFPVGVDQRVQGAKGAPDYPGHRGPSCRLRSVTARRRSGRRRPRSKSPRTPDCGRPEASFLSFDAIRITSNGRLIGRLLLLRNQIR